MSNHNQYALISQSANATNHSYRFLPTALKDSMLKTHILFCCILLCNTILLLFMISQTSIYVREAKGFFLNETLPYYLANLGVRSMQHFFPYPLLYDYGLRLPFVCIHICNCILLYIISLHILRKPNDALLAVLLFMAIPGVSVQALIVSNAGILTLLCLLVVFIQVRYNRIAYEFFALTIFIDSGGAIICLALFFYALMKRNIHAIYFSIVCFGINMYQFAPIHGVPQSYFLDTLGLMALVFTPVFFVYYVAATYSYTFKKSPLLLHFIPFVGFLFILLFSTRQKIEIESFLPPLCVGIPFFIQKILFDVRSRLPLFRKRYVLRVYALIAFLLFGNIALFGNKITYYISDEKHNFAYSFYGAKEIAQELHKKGITSIYIPYDDLALRLRFYGINGLQESPPTYALQASSSGDIVVTYGKIVVAQYSVIPIAPALYKP